MPTAFHQNTPVKHYCSLHHLLQLSFPDKEASIMPSPETGIMQ